MPGSHNDINVLDRSPLFAELQNGRAPAATFRVNGHEYQMGYFLADGIYPPWATLVQTISQPQGVKKKHFATMQEAVRKDVERAFGVLQARFAIVSGPARFWRKEDMSDIMTACIILHNMIVEDEREIHELDFNYDLPSSFSVSPPSHEANCAFDEFVRRYRSIRTSTMHHQLRNDLIEHLWQRKGEEK